MRSLPSGLFAQIASPEHLWLAFREVRSGKRRGPVMAAYERIADRDVLALSRELAAGTYRPCPWRLRLIRDPKPRLIAAPEVRDRVVHRALLDTIGPHFARRFMPENFTRGPGTGLHPALLAHLAAMRRFGFRLHLDIRHYFPSVRHAILERLLFRELRDRRVRWLIQQILASGARVYRSVLARQALGPEVLPLPPRTGLPLGSWFSQWAGTFYLDGLDHYVKRSLKIRGYLRYMDDFVLFADEESELVSARREIAAWLAEHRALALNPRHGRIEPTTTPTVFLGYRVSHAGFAPSRKLRRRMRGRLRSAAAKGPEAFARTLISYRGLMLF
jgi:hypothetical protein